MASHRSDLNSSTGEESRLCFCSNFAQTGPEDLPCRQGIYYAPFPLWNTSSLFLPNLYRACEVNRFPAATTAGCSLQPLKASMNIWFVHGNWLFVWGREMMFKCKPQTALHVIYNIKQVKKAFLWNARVWLINNCKMCAACRWEFERTSWGLDSQSQPVKWELGVGTPWRAWKSRPARGKWDGMEILLCVINLRSVQHCADRRYFSFPAACEAFGWGSRVFPEL